MENRQTFFETKIKPKLSYVGTLGAILMCVAYIIVVCVMIFGFKVKSIQQSIIFATVNGLVGLIIMQFLKIQGIDFAKSLEKNKKIIEDFNGKKEKAGKKYHSITYYWVISLIKDIALKSLSIVLASAGIIYIVIEGSNDYCLLLLALVNLIMFVCFGFLSLCNAYDFFNNEHIPYIENLLKEKEENVSDK